MKTYHPNDGKTMLDLDPSLPIDFAPIGWQCNSCKHQTRYCNHLNFRQMDIADEHNHLPVVLVYCSEHTKKLIS